MTNTPSDSGERRPPTPQEMAARMAAIYAPPSSKPEAPKQASTTPPPHQVGGHFAERMQNLKAKPPKLSHSEVLEQKERETSETSLPDSLTPAEQARVAMEKYIPKSRIPSDQEKTYNSHGSIDGSDVKAHVKAAKLATIEVLLREKQYLFVKAQELPFDDLVHEIQDIMNRGSDGVWENIRLKMTVNKLWQAVYSFQETASDRKETDLDTKISLYTLLKGIPISVLRGITAEQSTNLKKLMEAYEQEGVTMNYAEPEVDATILDNTVDEPQYLDMEGFMNPGVQPASFLDDADTSGIELDDNDRKQLLFFENFTDADLNRYCNQAKTSPTNLLGVYDYFRSFSFQVSQVLLKRPSIESRRVSYSFKIYEKFKELKAIEIGNIGLPDHTAPITKSRPPQFVPLSSGNLSAPSIRVPSTSHGTSILAQQPTSIDLTPSAGGIKNRHKKIEILRAMEVTKSSSNTEDLKTPLATSDTIASAIKNALDPFNTSSIPLNVQEYLLLNMPYIAYMQLKDGTWKNYFGVPKSLEKPLSLGLALGGQGTQHEDLPSEAILRKVDPIATLVDSKLPRSISTVEKAVEVFLWDNQKLYLIPEAPILKNGDSIEITVRDGEKKNQHVVSEFYGKKLAIGEEFRTDLGSCNGFITDVQYTTKGEYQVTLIRINEKTQTEENLIVKIKSIRSAQQVPEYIRERMSGATLSRTVDTDTHHFEQYDKHDIEFMKGTGLTKFLTNSRQLTEFHGDRSATMTLQCTPSFVIQNEDGSVVERIMAISLCNPAENKELFKHLAASPTDTPEGAEKKRLLLKDLSRIGLYLFEKDGSGWSAVEKETNITIPTNKAITDILQTIPNILRVDKEILTGVNTLFETKTSSSVRPRLPATYDEASARYELQNPDLQTFQSKLNAMTRIFDSLSNSEWQRGGSVALATTAIPTKEVLESVVEDDALWRGIPSNQRDDFYTKLKELKNPKFKPKDDWLTDLSRRWDLYLKQILKVGVSELFDQEGTIVNQKFSRYPLRLPKSKTPLTVSVAIEQSESGKLSEVMTSSSFKRRDGVVKLETTSAYHCYVKITSAEGDDLLIHVLKEKGKAPTFVDWSAHSLSNLGNANQLNESGTGYKPLSHLPEFYQNIIGTRSLGFENLAPTFHDYMHGKFQGGGFDDDKFMLIPLLADIGALLTAVESGRLQQ